MTQTVCFAVAALALAAAAAAVLWNRRSTKRLMDRMSAMLDDAMDGSFRETDFDESRLSALESRMARYLTAGRTSARTVEGERDQIRTLIADISHQTKTPVANLLLYAQLLGEKELPEDCRTAVEALQSQAEKLSFLISSLVKLSRLETGIIAVAPRSGPVSELLEGVGEEIMPKASDKGIAFIVDSTEAEAAFDPKWTAEALYNLADNAVKYTPPGGSVRLSACTYELFCRIDVTDTGMGIPEEEQGKIFTRFYRSPAAAGQEGVGIGLFLARQIVSSQGGYIKVASRPGQGSTFSVFLPRQQAAPAAKIRTPRHSEANT